LTSNLREISIHDKRWPDIRCCGDDHVTRAPVDPLATMLIPSLVFLTWAISIPMRVDQLAQTSRSFSQSACQLVPM